MIPIATSLIATSFITTERLLENKGLLKPGFPDKSEAENVDVPKPDLCDQQIIAGLALNLFFADSMQIFSFDECLVNIIVHSSCYLTQPESEEVHGTIWQARSRLMKLLRDNETLKNGLSVRNDISEYTSGLTGAGKAEEVVSFSKVLAEKKIIFIYNTSLSEVKGKFILMHNDSCTGDTEMDILYGYNPSGTIILYHSILNNKPISYIRIHLDPLQFVILKN